MKRMIATGQYTISKIYDGSKGEQGLSVSKVSTQYYLSTSPTSLTGGNWEDTQLKVTTGKYLWERNKTTLSDNSVVYSDAYYAQTISGLVSDVDNVKGQITDKVWQSDITTSINSYDSSTVSTIRDRVTTTEQNISGITTRVSDVESTTGSLGTRLTSAESSITQNAENIELKVAKDGVISAINQSAESITISADKVNIAGSTSFTSLSNQVTAIQNEADRNAELIRGTQESGTYSWTGTSLTISQLTDGTEIRYWLPYSVGGSQVSKGYSYYDGSKTTTGTNSGVVLTLTLKDGTTTEEIPVYYGSMTRLTSHYGYGNIIRMIYRENVRVNNSNTTYYTVEKGFWCDGNYDTNSAYTQYSNGVLVGANSIFQYSLLMKDTANTWVSIVTSGGTGTSKGTYTGGLIYDKITFHSSSSTYTTGKTSGNVYDSISFDFRYSTNCGTTLTNRRPVYLVGTINQNNGLFYLDQTQWWTQTVPTTADGKTYIYVGEAYSNYQVWLATDNKAYQYYDGKFITLEEIRDAESRKWINTTGQNAADIIANWATDATSATTTINGGLIQTHTIESTHLATDAIMSNNFQASQNTNSPYSITGSFLDLNNGNFYTPNFGLDNVNGNAYFNGEITATSGQIGDDTSNHWQIGTVVDFNGNQSAAIESNGTSYIQSGDWMISNNRIDTRHYDNQRKYTYLYEDGVYWDFGLHTPSLTSDNDYENNFIYIRNHESTIPTLEGAWNYVFRVDRNGMIYINGVSLDNKYASIDGVSGAYLPMTGGNLTGNLSVGGNLSVTGTITGLKNLSVNGKTYNGTEAVTVGTIGAAYGGTGQTSLINSANALINALDNGGSVPVDNDYYISQYVNGGTTTKTYHRRPMSALWLYIKGKINADTDLYTDKFVPKTGGEFTGAVTVSDALIADEITSGNLIVNGVGRFTNGIYGDLTGNASTATVAAKVADSGNGQATTFAYSKSSLSTTAYFAAWNGYELRAINPSNTLATIGAVNKTGDTMTGSLTVPTLKVNSIVNEGYVHRIDFGRPNVNQMDFYEYGGVFNFYRNTSQTSIENATLLGKITTNGWEGNVVGNVTGNASSASQLSTAGTIQTNLASTSAITYTSGGNITTGVTGTLPIANGGTGATTAQDALWNLARSADPSDLNTAKRLGIFKISNTTTNVPVKNNWGVALNITDDRAEGNTAGGSTWQFVMDTASTDVWLRRITNKNAWTSWTRFYSTSNKPTKSDVGLGNVTNNAQVKGLSSGTTSGHLVTWGSDGYTVADSGIAKGSVTTKITLSGTDYSASSNTITITKANLQSAVQDTSLVLMTAAERSKLSSIQVSEGGTIDFSGVTASAPITATVNETTKAVNITHNTSGVAQGTYRSVTVNTYGHVTAGTNPTTLSGYGITDAKIASGVITLGSNTITPLTANSTLDATKLSGTASIDTTGNAATATSATKANITTVANSVAKYSDTSGTFTDSYITIDSSGNLIIGDNDHPANIKIGAKNDNYGLMPNVNNYNQIGASGLSWYKAYVTHYYGTTSHVSNWVANSNIGEPATSSVASTLGNVNFYNTCAVGETQTKTKLQADSTTASNITVTLPKETGTLALTKNYQPYAHYWNSNDNYSGRYYKISINSYVNWMLSFTVRIYHTYRAYDLQISGYNYGTNHWYQPQAIILGASVNNSINVLFGYDSDYHLWVAIPAERYAGIDVVNVTNGFRQVDSLEGLFTIEMVDSEPTTVQNTVTAYRPWYRNETVSNANNATNATTATNATNATNLLAYAGNEVTIGANYATSGSSTNNSVYINYRDINGGSTSNNATAITDYYFYNRKGSMDGVNVRAGTFVGSLSGTATKATQDGNGNTISSTYLKLSGGTMTGTEKFNANLLSLNFRADNTAYTTGLYHGTSGNEALALATKNAVTSFMVVHGSDPTTWNTSTWTGASPTLQTKNNSLYVHELIPNNTTPTYNFKVNGTSYLGGNVRISDTNADTASCEMQYNRDLQCIEFIFN